jgi:hypothetical protein
MACGRIDDRKVGDPANKLLSLKPDT